MSGLAIIGGTGLTSLDGLNIVREEQVKTPFGEPSSALVYGELNDNEVAFIARHGRQHTIPPHRVNYRANLWALKQAGISQIIAVAAVGGIHNDMGPMRIVIPDQIIDYTYSRVSTFFEDDLEHVTHIDFSYPYSQSLRETLLASCESAGVDACDFGTYGATQGPRLESVAEIERMSRDGCAIVGMTGMPEASLARELEIDYACCSVVANWAAGRGDGKLIEMSEIEENLETGMAYVRDVLACAVPKCLA